MRFDGAPNLGDCSARVSGSGQGSMGCGEGAGPAQNPRLMFRMFDMEMYAVDPLLAQPSQPMQYCSRSSSPVSVPVPVPAPVTPPKSSSPHFNLPPLPALPPMPPLPPVTFAEASACPSE